MAHQTNKNNRGGNVHSRRWVQLKRPAPKRMMVMFLQMIVTVVVLTPCVITASSSSSSSPLRSFWGEDKRSSILRHLAGGAILANTELPGGSNNNDGKNYTDDTNNRKKNDLISKLDDDKKKKDDDSLFLPFPSSDTSGSSDSSSSNEETAFFVYKRDGRRELFDPDKIFRRLSALADLETPQGDCNNNEHNSEHITRLDTRYVNLTSLTESIVRGIPYNVTAREIDILAAESAASLSTQHPDYARLAARVLITQNHKTTPPTFSQAMLALCEATTTTTTTATRNILGEGKQEEGEEEEENDERTRLSSTGYVHPTLADLVRRRGQEIDAQIQHDRDYSLTYFGFKTLERAYLLRHDNDSVLERPQYLFMRVALGIHCCCSSTSGGTAQPSRAEEDACLQAAFQTYHLMSRGFFTHASPTLFHAGTTHPQLSSCFLLQMSEDSINGIYDTLKQCAVISKAAGGIGLCVHKIRARG